MTPAYGLSCNDHVLNWLTRVDTQYDEATPEKVKAVDSERARQTLESNTIYNLFFSSPRPLFYTPPQPSSTRLFSSDTTTNSHNTTHIHNTTHVHNAPADSSSDFEDEGAKDSTKKKKTKEEKTNWKGIAAIGVVSTAVAGVSIFVYARLSKAAEGARNYLENTTAIGNWANTSLSRNSDYRINQIAQVAEIQLEIDTNSVNKITNYKYSILTSLVGTLVIAGGGITILAAAPALATAGITAVVAGGVLNSLAALFAAYNCTMHWSDEKEGKDKFNGVKRLIPNLVTAFTPNAQPQTQNYPTNNWQNPQWTEQPPAYNESAGASSYYAPQPSQWEATYSYSSGHSEPFVPMTPPPPSYEESQAAIRNQRENPRNIYPDLSGFAPSAPSYESLNC